MQGVVGETWGCLNDEFVCSVQDRSYWLTLLHCTWGIFGGKTCFECFVFFFFVRIFCRTLAKIYWLRLLQFPMGIGKFLEVETCYLFFSFFFTLCWFIDFPLFYSLMLGGNFFIKKVMLLKWLIDHGFLFNLLAVFFFFFIFLHFFFFFFLRRYTRV